MKCRVLIAAILISIFSSSVMAQVSSGVAYHHFDEGDIAVGALVGSIGYRFVINESVSLIPELRGGIGVNDDRFQGVDVELDALFGGVLRLEVDLNETFYVQLSPSYVRYKLDFSAPVAGGTFSLSETSNDFGIGGGIGFRANRNFSLEIGYENIDSVDVFMFGARFDY